MNEAGNLQNWQLVAKQAQMIFDALPQARAIGLKIIEVTKDYSKAKVSFNPAFIGNKEKGTMASGVLVTLLDQLCGTAAMAALANPIGVATLDMRIDYLGSPKAGSDYFAIAECYRVTKSIAFVRAFAFDDEACTNKIAATQASFVISQTGIAKEAAK